MIIIHVWNHASCIKMKLLYNKHVCMGKKEQIA